MTKTKIIAAAVLMGIVFVIFSGVNYWRENKAELIIKASDFLEVAAAPYRIARLSALSPDATLPIPVQGVLFREIEDSWGAPRSGGRSHGGIDIFASRGTPVYAAADGFVLRTGQSELGGNYVYTVGAGGRRYYYAHLDSFVSGIRYGQPVTTETVLGYVGNTGNASTTPPHLHFGLYVPQEGAINPFEFFVSRENQ